MGLQYSIDVLSALKEAGYNQSFLQQEKIITSKTLNHLRHAEPINWHTIEKLCTLLRCQPSDFLEWTPDD